ncbi:MAG: 16S rRNA (guanine(527)-N(7))-methyltransferase RsmG [Anaerolineales bacterium]
MTFEEDVHDLLGIELTPHQVSAFDRYEKELISWNQRFNITTIVEPSQIRVKHFLDSLSCWLAIRESPGSLIDVGAGGGFPGLPLKILQPRHKLALVEATAKKAGFLEHMVQVLSLKDASVIAKRAEEAGQLNEHREVYHWAVARAVAPLRVLAEYLLPLVEIGGFVLAQKGKDAEREIEEATNAIKVLGGKLSQTIPVEVPNLEEERALVVIKKIAPTPSAYPRRPGIPGKRPL